MDWSRKVNPVKVLSGSLLPIETASRVVMTPFK
jgi:hypothetical protein